MNMPKDALAPLVRRYSETLSKRDADAARALAEMLEAPGAATHAEALSAAAPSKARLRAWRALLATLRGLAVAFRADAEMTAELGALDKALTEGLAMRTQDVVAREKTPTTGAARTKSRRSSKMENAVISDARRRQIVDELRSETLTEDRQKSLMRELAEKTNGFTAADHKAIAQAVTGTTYRSGKAALEDLERWSWKRTQLRKATEAWGETAASRL